LGLSEALEAIYEVVDRPEGLSRAIGAIGRLLGCADVHMIALQASGAVLVAAAESDAATKKNLIPRWCSEEVASALSAHRAEIFDLDVLNALKDAHPSISWPTALAAAVPSAVEKDLTLLIVPLTDA